MVKPITQVDRVLVPLHRVSTSPHLSPPPNPHPCKPSFHVNPASMERWLDTRSITRRCTSKNIVFFLYFLYLLNAKLVVW